MTTIERAGDQPVEVRGITRAKVRMERVQVGEAESQFGMRLTDM